MSLSLCITQNLVLVPNHRRHLVFSSVILLRYLFKLDIVVAEFAHFVVICLEFGIFLFRLVQALFKLLVTVIAIKLLVLFHLADRLKNEAQGCFHIVCSLLFCEYIIFRTKSYIYIFSFLNSLLQLHSF